jgi:NADPH:quinone reductase-like Zn-dependent oxidoreductase
MGLVGGGAHAEYVTVREGELLAVPEGFNWPAAAAIPEAFLTAWDALAVRARLRAGERVLIHAAASGVGTAAIQVARRIGALVIGTSRSAAKLERLAPLGLARAIDTSSRPFQEQLGGPVDVILDLIGGPAFAANLEALAPRGRMVLVGFLAGGRFTGDLGPILRKRLEVVGTMMRVRGPEERSELAAGWRRELAAGFEAGELRPVVGAEFPMAEMAAAQTLMEGDGLFGKCVLTW